MNAWESVIGRLNTPDRFDSYSLGMVLIQAILPQLKRDNALVTLRRALEKNNHNLDSWRSMAERRALTQEQREGWEVLDMEGGVAWDLLKGLLKGTSGNRLSMRQILGHPFVSGKKADARVPMVDNESQAMDRMARWIGFRLAKTGTDFAGGFTEAQLAEAVTNDEPLSLERARFYLGRLARETISTSTPYTKAQGRRAGRQRRRRG